MRKRRTPEEAGLYARYDNVKRAAEDKDKFYKHSKLVSVPFELTIEEFNDLSHQNCYYCGAPPDYEYHPSNGVFVGNGIDRIDNTKGYTMDNVVPCCPICNAMKNALTLDEFLSQSVRIAQNIAKNNYPYSGVRATVAKQLIQKRGAAGAKQKERRPVKKKQLSLFCQPNSDVKGETIEQSIIDTTDTGRIQDVPETGLSVTQQ
jgi:hypothetical protein